MHLKEFSSYSWEEIETHLNINLHSPLKLCHIAMADMKKRKQGTIINIASIAHHSPLQGGTTYCASKAGLALASEVMHNEAKNYGIHVLTVYPGPVSTDLEKGARANVEDNLVANMLPTGTKEELARHIYEGMVKLRRDVVYPMEYRIGKILPEVTGWVMEQFSPKPRE